MSTIDSTSDSAGSAPELSRSAPGRALGVALGVTLAAFLASLLFGLGTDLALDVLVPDLAGVTAIVLLFVAGQVAFLVVALAYVWRTGLTVSIRPPTLRDLGWIAGGVVVSLVAAVVLGLLRTLVFPDTGSVVGDVAGPDPVLFLYLAVLSLVLVGPAEELLFRGVVQGRLRRSLSAVPAVLAASGFFAVMHVLNFTGSLVGALAAAAVVGAVSLLWGFAYERTENLLVPMVVHGVYNFVLFGLSYVAFTVVG